MLNQPLTSESSTRSGCLWVISVYSSGVRESEFMAGHGIRKLGGGFKHFLFSPVPGEDEPNLTNIFQMG